MLHFWTDYIFDLIHFDSKNNKNDSKKLNYTLTTGNSGIIYFTIFTLVINLEVRQKENKSQFCNPIATQVFYY